MSEICIDGNTKVKIHAIASIPRLGFQDAFAAMTGMFSSLGIPWISYTGAFWNKCTQNALNDLINDVDWILATDYDTVATAFQLQILMKTFAQNPHMDALAAMQPRRGNGAPLMTVKDEKTGRFLMQVVGEAPIKCYTAHFGLTLIRTKALRDLQKPWFLHVPDDKGEFGPASVDPDIYFWKKWAEAGKTLYTDPNCRIGHLEVMVSIFDDFMVQRHISATRWRELYCPSQYDNSLEKQDTKG